MNLTDKLVAITGASSGIGAACAAACAALGANLLLIARRTDKLEQVAEELQAKYQARVFVLTLDVSDLSAVQQSFAALPPDWQQIDILINNAGFALGKDPLHSYDPKDLAAMVDTNINGVIYLTHTVLPKMLARKSGHIVNLGSISSYETYAGGTVYCATKFAIKGLTDGLRKDLLGTNIRVSLISPGMVKTEFSEVRFQGDHTKAESVYAGMTPLVAADIADAVVYSITRPAHVTVSEMLVLPTHQASNAHVYRENLDK